MLPRPIKFAILTLLALLTIIPAFAADVTFSGQVAYRERMALPPNSSLTVTLVGLPGGKRVASARANLGDKVGSPIQFSLNVRSNVLTNRRAYGLIAEIAADGYVFFSNAQPVPIDLIAPSAILIPVQFTPPPPQEAPKQILPPVETPNPLLGIVWTVTSIGGDPVLPLSTLTLSIAADHRTGGSGGCNSYFTEADFSSPPLSFSPIAGTKMACDPAIMVQETRFFAALGATAGYELAGNALNLFDAAGIALVGLMRQP